MHRKRIILFTVLTCLYSQCGAANNNDSLNSTITSPNKKTPEIPQINMSSNQQQMNSNIGEIDVSEAATKCNESFQIPINYLEEMNMTGSYPDETEKPPMCFMKCLMEMIGVLTSDNEMVMKQASSYYETNEDILNSCYKEMADIDSFDPCEYAYFLARCITMATLVDNRKLDT